MGEWVPDPGGVSKVALMLLDGSSGSNAQQEMAYRTLKELSEHPQFDMYLAYVMNAGAPGVDENQRPVIRQSAGLLLKNQLKESSTVLSMEAKETVKRELLMAIGDSTPQIQQTAAIAIATLVRTAGLAAWPELLSVLRGYLHSGDPAYMRGATFCLAKLCEDSLDKLEADPDQALEKVISWMLEFVAVHGGEVRAQALHAVNHMLFSMPLGLQRNLDKLLKVLSEGTTDGSTEVRKNVCIAFSRLVESAPNVMDPHLHNVFMYVLQLSESGEDELAMEATNFWLVYCEMPGAKHRLGIFVPQIVDVLLRNVVYKSDDSDLIDADEDCAVPDPAEQIRPWFHNARNIGEGGNDEDAERISNWTLRKSSAAGLDVLSTVLGNDLLQHVLPVVERRLADAARWEQRESAVLALGACAEGCYTGMLQYLPALMTHLLQMLREDHTLVRSITCWTISRYAKWFAEPDAGNAGEQVLHVLLAAMLDRNKRVEAAACSAVAALVEEFKAGVEPMLGPLLKALAAAYDLYQRKNQLILYDAVGTIAERVGPELAKPEHLNVILPPLMVQWHKLPDNDVLLLPLLECLSVLIKSVGAEAARFSPPLYARSLSIAKGALVSPPQGTNGADYAELNTELATCCLDLLAAIAEALGPMMGGKVDAREVGGLVLHAVRMPQPELRQSAYALLGDLARAQLEFVVQLVPELMQLYPAALDTRFVNVSNNATWALGEMLMLVHHKGVPARELFAAPNLEAILTQLVRTLKSPYSERGPMENTTITLGRLGVVFPAVLAPALGEVLRPMCLILRNMQDGDEKEDACLGLISAIKLNPDVLRDSFVFFCDCAASWQEERPQLKAEFALILDEFRKSMGPSWADYFSGFQDPLRLRLQQQYHL